VNAREVPGRYVDAVAVPRRRDIAVRALEDEQRFGSSDEGSRDGIRARGMPDDDELLGVAPEIAVAIEQAGNMSCLQEARANRSACER
jgi:hypothetical protein